jgi:uncharacterized protein (DUF2062 family)
MNKCLLRMARRFSPHEAAPETIAFSLALGLVLGVFPCYGAPTLLCIAAAVLFRTHAPLMHAVNAATGPLQLALLLPFHRLGAALLARSGAARTRPNFVAGLWDAFAQTAAGWLLAAIPVGLLLYFAALWGVRRLRQHPTNEAPHAGASAPTSMRSSIEGIS